MIIPILIRNLYNEKLDGFVVWFLEFCIENHIPMIAEDYFEDIIKQKISNIAKSKGKNEEELLNAIEIYYWDSPKAELTADYFIKRFRDLDKCLETFLYETFKQIEENTSIEGVIVFCETSYTLKCVLRQKNLKCINIEASAIRKNHNYTQTLFWGNIQGELYGTNECEYRYEKFLNEKANDIQIFSRQELIAIFDSIESISRIPFMESFEKNEIGICGQGYAIIPYLFIKEAYTDDDLRIACYKEYDEKELEERKHIGHYSAIEQLENNTDVHNFVLSNKRICSIASNVLYTAMLWGRVACCKNNLLGCSFACEKDFKSLNKVDLKLLNWLTFACFVPSQLCFDLDYWLWRLKGQKESDIYKRHMEVVFQELALNEIKLIKKEDRFEYILKTRGVNEYTISQILNNDIRRSKPQYNCLTSKISINNESLFSSNCFVDDYILSEFEYDIDGDMVNVEFYPLVGIGGFVTIVQLCIIDISTEEMLYKTSMQNHFCAPMFGHKFIIDCANVRRIGVLVKWKYKMLSSGIVDNDIIDSEYKFPFDYIKHGERVIIYGYGKVGKYYERINRAINYFNLEMVVDSNYEQLKKAGADVHSVNDLINVEYDKVLIAVEKRKIAEEIIDTLKKCNVPTQKIAYCDPRKEKML